MRQVKKFESGMVVNPVTIAPGRDAGRRARPDEGAPHLRHSGGRGRRQRPRRQARRHPHQPRRALRHRSAPAGLRADDQGRARSRCARASSQDEAKRLLHQHRIEKLLVVDDDYRCVGLITVKDIEKAVANPNACKDEQGRLRVAAATTRRRQGLRAHRAR